MDRRKQLALIVGVALFALAGCFGNDGRLSPAAESPSATPKPTKTPVGTVSEERVWVPPKWTRVGPSSGPPGTEAQFEGSGGYHLLVVPGQDGYGYDESHIGVELFFGNHHIGGSCYVNRCDSQFVIPEWATPGVYKITPSDEEEPLTFTVTNAPPVTPTTPPSPSPMPQS